MKNESAERKVALFNHDNDINEPLVVIESTRLMAISPNLFASSQKRAADAEKLTEMRSPHHVTVAMTSGFSCNVKR